MSACARLAALALVLGVSACDRSGSPAPHDAGPTSSAVASAVASVGAPTRPLPLGSAAPVPETIDERVARLHREAIIVDGHDDIPSIIVDTGFDLGAPNGKTHTDLPKMRAGGITASFFSIYVDADFADKPTAKSGSASRRALDLIDATYRQIERYPADLVLATRVADIRAAKRDGKIAVLMGIEGGHAIENSLSALRAFHRLGVRYMTLTHTNTNAWADSSGADGRTAVKHHGLSPFGEEVVREMQRIGMLVDVSHVSDETFFAVMRLARCPVIASHSSSRALASHPRNLTDDMLRALAKNGGVAMVNFYTAFLDPTKKGRDLPISVLLDHIEHMVRVAGVDHVGLGSDFDGVPSLPRELATGIDALPAITRGLVERGYSDGDVKKILGENFLRAMAAAEELAAPAAGRVSADGSTRKLE